MTPVIDKAFKAYFHQATRSVALYQGDCEWSGLSVLQDKDMDSYGPVLITGSVGTARMDVSGGQLTWDNDRFGGWVVCKAGTGIELSYWDVVTNRRIDNSLCAKVQLLTHYVEREA